MTTQSIPRFIQTQGGSFLNIACITIMGCKPGENGSARVCADVLPQRCFVLGVYDNEDDARAALAYIMRGIAIIEDVLIQAPVRDFCTEEMGE